MPNNERIALTISRWRVRADPSRPILVIDPAGEVVVLEHKEHHADRADAYVNRHGGFVVDIREFQE